MTDPRVAIVRFHNPLQGHTDESALRFLSALDAHLTSQETVERVARAMHNDEHRRLEASGSQILASHWRDIGPIWLRRARAALAAMVGGGK